MFETYKNESLPSIMIIMNPNWFSEFWGKWLIMLKERYYHPKTCYLR